jgi:hypothetical protein
MKQGEKVLVPAVETISNLSQKKRKVFSGHAAERIRPVPGVTPDPLDPVEVVPSFRPTFLLADDHMIALKPRAIGVHFVGVVQAARLGARTNR